MRGIDWRKAAWECLGTAGRMAELAGLITQAGPQAGTEEEKQRVALWRSALWDWMRQGHGVHQLDAAPGDRASWRA